MKSLSSLALIAALGPVRPSVAQIRPEYPVRSVTIGSHTYKYRVYLPPGHDPKRRYPVILFLHGSQNRGEDNLHQLSDGLPLVTRVASRLRAKPYLEFIAVFPQCATDAYWVGENADQAVKALDQTVAEFNGDPDRLYLTGFSMGGYGSWYLAAKYPGKFAAMVPIGGHVRVAQLTIPMKFPPQIASLMHPEMLDLYQSADPYGGFVKAVGNIPIWAFHGGEDDQVPIDDGRNAWAALKAGGANARYTEYAGEQHFVYDRAYTEPGFWTWLFAQRLSHRKAH